MPLVFFKHFIQTVYFYMRFLIELKRNDFKNKNGGRDE